MGVIIFSQMVVSFSDFVMCLLGLAELHPLELSFPCFQSGWAILHRFGGKSEAATVCICKVGVGHAQRHLPAAYCVQQPLALLLILRQPLQVGPQ